MKGLYFLAFTPEGAQWWKKLFKHSKWKDLGRGEAHLHLRNSIQGGRGDSREPQGRVSRPEAPVLPVSIQAAVIKFCFETFYYSGNYKYKSIYASARSL